MMTSGRVRQAPRISVNKLGEYLVAGASRRRTILEQQKRPSTFMVNYYDDAIDGIRLYYAGGQDEKVLHERLDRLDTVFPASEYEDQKRVSCIEALEAFVDLLPDLDLSRYAVTLGDVNPPQLVVNQVAISVRPELLLSIDEQLVGAVKFHMSKGKSLTPPEADYIATTTHQYLEEVLGAGSPRERDVLVVDLQRRRSRVAPKSFRRRRQDIASACEEIAARWTLL